MELRTRYASTSVRARIRSSSARVSSRGLARGSLRAGIAAAARRGPAGGAGAAIGGKTGINHALCKNLIGAFHQPRLVVVDVTTLRSLPRREFVAGLAEVIKYAVIRDAELFATLEARLDALLGLDESVLVPVVATSCEHKAAVVAADEREESGGRAVVNFGPTVGRALEGVTEYR